MSPLVFKVYTRPGKNGVYIAAFRYIEDAALLVGNLGYGVIKHDGAIVWREGDEHISAAESADDLRRVVHERIHERIPLTSRKD